MNSVFQLIRKSVSYTLFFLLAFFTFACPSYADENVEHSWDFDWKNGPVYELNRLLPRTGTSFDKLDRYAPDFKLSGRVGGDIFLDGGALEDSEEFDNGFHGRLRRGRLYTAGRYEGLHIYDYRVQFALENNSLFFNDFYVRHPFWEERHYIKVGYFDPPVSLEALSSIGNYALMELPSAVSTLAPGLRLGMEYGGYIPNPHFIWMLNLSTIGQNNQNEGQGGGSSPARVSARIVHLPHYQSGANKDHLLHFGLSYSFFAAGSEELQLRSRPESFLAPYTIDTGSLPLENGQTLGAEFLSIRGSFLNQIEFLGTRANYEASDTGIFYGAYYQTSYVFYGRTRTYDPSRGVILGIDNRTRDDTTLPGAFEIAGRLSFIDLDSNEVSGGTQKLATLGLNWFLNSHLAFKFEYIYGIIEREDSDAVSLVQGRFQLQF